MTGRPKLSSRLIDDMGFDPIDTGSLADGGRRQQPGSHLFNALNTNGGGNAEALARLRTNRLAWLGAPATSAIPSEHGGAPSLP